MVRYLKVVNRPRYRRREYIHVVSQNVNGQIVDIYSTQYGWCYSVNISSTDANIQVLESDLIIEGDQSYESKRLKNKRFR